MRRSPILGWVARCAAAIALLALVGCPGGDPLANRAESACLAVVEQEPQYAAYALSVAADGQSPFSRRLLTDALGSDDYQTALGAAKALAQNPDPAAEPALRQVHGSKEGSLKLWAAAALAGLGDAATLEWLKGQIEKTGGMTQLDLIVLLARRGEQDFVVPLIRKKMQAESLEVRNEAYAVLGRIAQPWTTKLLLEGFEKEHGESREVAIVALGQSGDASVAPKLAPFVNTRGLVFVTLEALGRLKNPKTQGAVEKMVKSTEPRVRAYAAVALWKMGALASPEATLGPIVSDENLRTRIELAEQLATVEGDKAGSLLLALAEDQEQEVRAAAVRAIGTRGEGYVGALLERARDPAYTVAAAALAALGRVAGADALTELEPLLDHDNPYVVISAALAILEIKARQQPAA